MSDSLFDAFDGFDEKTDENNEVAQDKTTSVEDNQKSDQTSLEGIRKAARDADERYTEESDTGNTVARYTATGEILTSEGEIIDPITIPDDSDEEMDEDPDETDFAKEVIKKDGSIWLPEEYEPYTKMVLTDRAFADSDGQKPVNRRILWSMYQTKATSQDKHVKAAKIVGNTMGSYHPHGDAAISDALARMAQSFVNRVPLVDPEGTVGKVAGDEAAAPRYWEARLTPAAMELLSEVNQGAAVMIDSYDGENQIPAILPSRWPALIVNGTSGIGVGYASNVPPHNPSEVMDAVIAYIRNPEISVDEILKISKGPDFPDGGVVEGIDGIKNYYETGRGTFYIKAHYEIEYPKKGLAKIIFTDIPYGVSAEAIKKKVQSLIDPKPTSKNKKPKPNEILAKGLSSIEDLSDKETNGILIECTVNVGHNPKDIARELMDKTPLKTSFSVNSNILVDGKVEQASIFDMIRIFVDSRRISTVRRLDTRIEKISDKVHQLEGILLALVDLDKVIKIIRGSESQAEAKAELVKEMKLSDSQADYILAMQLRRLTKSDAHAIESEKKELDAEVEEINRILSTPELLDENIIEELLKTKKVIDSERRTTILDVTTKDVAERKKKALQMSRNVSKNIDCYITRFANGHFLKTYEPFTYDDEKYKRTLDHTPAIEQIKTKTQETIVIVTSEGNGHRIPVSYIPDDVALGIHAFGLEEVNPDEIVVGISKDKIAPRAKDVGLAIATSNGGIKITKAGDYPTKDTFPVISLAEGEKVVGCRWISTQDDLLFSMVSSDGNIILFESSSVRPAGHKAGSVKGMKLKNDDSQVIYFNTVNPEADMNVVITLSDKTIKQTGLHEITIKGRGGMGVATQGFRKGEGKLIDAFVGSKPVISTASDTHGRMLLPQLKARSVSGDPFEMKVLLGETSPEIV